MDSIMWEAVIFLVGIWVIASVVLPIVAIIKLLNQQKQIEQLQSHVQHLEQKIHYVNSQVSQNITANLKTSPETIPTVGLQTTTSASDDSRISEPTMVIATKEAVAAPEPHITIATHEAETLTSSDWAASSNKPAINTHIAKAENAAKNPAKPLQPIDESSINIVTSLLLSIKNWFSGENLIVRVGAIVLLVGVVLLLKLASQYINVPIALRMAGVAVAGLAVTAIGYRVSRKRRSYGLTLQGVGFAMIYLTVFASFRLYNLVPANLSFGLLAVLAGLTVMFSVWQNALPLAILAFGGAFLAPILVSNPQGSAVMLFSYYLLLNVAVAIIAHYRTWKLLNAVSLGVTFGLAYVWGFNEYVHSTEHLKVWQTNRWQLVALLAAHLTLYLFIAVRYSQQVVAYNKQQYQTLVSIDSGLLFGTPLLGFGLLTALLQDSPYYLAVASSILSGIYIAIGFWLLKTYHRQRGDTQQNYNNSFQLLIEATLALGVAFLAVVLPLALSARWFVIGWAVQGASLVWLGQRTYRRWTVGFGLGLQLLTVLIIAGFDSLQTTWYGLLDMLNVPHHTPIADFAVTLPLSITTLAVGVSACLLRQGLVKPSQSMPVKASAKLADRCFTQLPFILVIVVAGLYVASALSWLAKAQLTAFQQSLGFMLLAVAALLMGQQLHQRFNWVALRQLSRFALPVVILLFYPVWHQYFLGHDSYDFLEPSKNSLKGLGIGIFSLLGLVGAAKLLGAWLLSRWHAEGLNIRFDQLAWFLALIAVMTTALTSIAFWNEELAYLTAILPTLLSVMMLILLDYLVVKNHRQLPVLFAWLEPLTLLRLSGYVIMPVSFLWLVVANYQLDGRLLGVYLPILNPLDLTLIAIILYMSYLTLYSSKQYRQILSISLGVAIFITLSSMLVRAFGYLLDTPTWQMGAWQVSAVQTGLTILWSMLATAFMFLASKKGYRQIWYIGMTLLAMVVIKLVTVDMSKTSAMLRVISFIGAGGLMLLIGYLAPLPPKHTKNETETKE